MSNPGTGEGARASVPAGAADAPELLVLVADPEATRGSFIGHALRRRFSPVLTALSVVEAADVAAREADRHRIIIAASPEPADLDLLGSLRDAQPALDFIVIAEAPDMDAAVAALRAGAADFLVRPCGIDQLERAVERVLARRAAATPGPPIARPVRRTSAGPAEPAQDAAAGLVGECKPVKALCRIIDRVAPMRSTVLIKGESGTGKELAAQAIHERSGRQGEFVPINCGAVSAELLESELFGHVKGAFTGAHQARDGLFSHAHGGTLFLDEIGEMPLGLQAKLLRVLEERRIRPVGGNAQVTVDARIVAATNRDLAAEVRAGRFREDLYYRLNVLEVRLPPLRERRDDIPALTRFFIGTLSAELGVAPPALDDEDLALLCAHPWPGNVRELRNVVERCLLLGQRPRDHLHSLGRAAEGDSELPDSDGDRSLAAAERRHILRVLGEANGDRNLAASMLGVSRKTVERKLRQWAQRAEPGQE
ncbi:MAG: sigma-54 dependent transcriptional regulator [Thiohalocapsa sp.]|uniref:sigma-54-dependent transcriptional regulator n=1 Tax=Thiohalocapsa sp. TaxID=2497641 RepID=UPI0025FD3FE2|nr:sigma-54 dependent transcriptional regulator [Thiohalocapsa sp.]MCG6940504.1 sigma-54 dependent transcriptional regulator [Thiohalocapsa sp.]